ncbi:MAG: helix-turn-helix transcriptional regulator [Actinomycetota bacterium]|nr:helix-turn-helix transcriptional regulator [Actinomycetota bacterium]
MKTMRQLRLERGMTQKELAVLLGVTHRTIAGAELGYWRPRPRTMKAIADALGVQIVDVREFAAAIQDEAA